MLIGEIGVESSIPLAQILSKPKTAQRNSLLYRAGTRYQAMLSVLITLTHLICTPAPWGQYHYLPDFTGGANKTSEKSALSKVTQQGAELGFIPWTPEHVPSVTEVVGSPLNSLQKPAPHPWDTMWASYLDHGCQMAQQGSSVMGPGPDTCFLGPSSV